MPRLGARVLELQGLLRVPFACRQCHGHRHGKGQVMLGSFVRRGTSNDSAATGCPSHHRTDWTDAQRGSSWQLAPALLSRYGFAFDAANYNAAIASCGKGQQWLIALAFLRQMPLSRVESWPVKR
eukprot:s283_g24.t1